MALPQHQSIQMALRNLSALWLMALLVSWLAAPQTARAEDARLRASIKEDRFITYTPRSFSVTGGRITPATHTGIKEDLAILRPNFEGVITYSSTNGVEKVVEVAEKLHYRSVIMGIWDPSSATEVNNVIQAFRQYPQIVIAVVVGNEGIFTKRYTMGRVQQTMQRLKKEVPALAMATSEPFHLYFSPELSSFFRSHDLLMPNIHPVFENWFKPEEPEGGVAMVLNVTEKFKAEYTLPLLIKETGIPSGEGAKGYSPARQARFWTELDRRFPVSQLQSFAYFEAFDAPWKPALMATEFPGDHANESHWGIFTAAGTAKEVVRHLSPRPATNSR